VSGRGERILWKIVEYLSHAAMIGWIPPPPEAFLSEHQADAGAPGQDEAEPVIDHRELDEWLASILGTEPGPE
jgi:hypothetical protein